MSHKNVPEDIEHALYGNGAVKDEIIVDIGGLYNDNLSQKQNYTIKMLNHVM